jgi:hypothetical protein
LPLVLGPAVRAQDEIEGCMTEQSKLQRPGPVYVSVRGDMDVRSIRLNAGSIGCTQRTFAAAIGVSVKNSAQLGTTPKAAERTGSHPFSYGQT